MNYQFYCNYDENQHRRRIGVVVHFIIRTHTYTIMHADNVLYDIRHSIISHTGMGFFVTFLEENKLRVHVNGNVIDFNGIFAKFLCIM